ncbi:MAG: ComEC/Rec2 family competence protein [Flavisolibacter sp.]
MHPIPFWNKVPCIRLLMPFMGGIIIQHEYRLPCEFLFICWVSSLVVVSLLFFISLKSRFRLIAINGIICCLMITITGSIITCRNDVTENKKWIGNINQAGILLLADLKEPVEEKAGTFRGIVQVRFFLNENYCSPACGKLIIYFKKDGNPPAAGTEILINKIPELVNTSGNPGSFDFKSYCLFQGITHQLYVTKDNYAIVATGRNSALESFIQQSRDLVLNCLKKNINGRELGLAEALLVGYKDDLDKNLVKAYSRTGVVHIIAISGMHLALIYGLLMFITYPLKKITWLRTLVILSGLWVFTLMAGAQASVTRSAVMFTCIALGALSGRKSFTFNTLALSAFVLLCYQPFWLWDVGFQLSYSAVLSILVFYKKMYGFLYLPNRILDGIWKTVAISLSAQVVTTPLTIFYFHQFPLLFILTNLVAVPLSGIILFAEIFLCMITWNAQLAQIAGHITTLLISLMNHYIERINNISFAVWNGFSVSVFEVMMMYILIASLSYWLIEKSRKALLLSLMVIISIGCIRSLSFIRAMEQQKIIYYNIPGHRAIGIVSGRTYFLFADNNLYADKQAFEMHISPSFILFRIKKVHAYSTISEINISGHRLITFDSSYSFPHLQKKINADVILLTGKFRKNITVLSQTFFPSMIIADVSVPPWKAALWKRECDSLKILFHYMKVKGAFVRNL